jgi:hypothetical protein
MTRIDPSDPWVVSFVVMSVATLGLLLVTDRYVELLAAGAAYGATWLIARREPARTDHEEQLP